MPESKTSLDCVYAGKRSFLRFNIMICFYLTAHTYVSLRQGSIYVTTQVAGGLERGLPVE